MDLLDRYLQAVKKHLPWQRQDDILAELRANLESQLEDREAELGRPLTNAEAEAWLKEIGPPIQMAARYQPQQYLIGPAVFPTYWYVLRMAFVWAMTIYAIVSAVQIFTEKIPNWTSVLEATLRVPVVLMTVASWVTLVFAGIEFTVTRYPADFPAVSSHFADWSPGSLPPLDKQATSGKKQRSYAIAVAEVIFGFLLLGWLLLIPKYPYLLMGPGAVVLQVSPFQLAQVWVQFYWCVIALNAMQLGWRCLALLRGWWQQPRPTEQIVMKVMGLIPLIVLITAGDHLFVTLKHPELDQARHGATLDTINYAIHHAVLIICLIAVLTLLWEVGQMALAAYRKQAAAIR